MNVGIIIVAHEPMASALHACGCHVFQCESNVGVYDVGSESDPVTSEAAILDLIRRNDGGGGVLVLTDVLGATPSNVAHRAVNAARAEGIKVELLAGANMPMLLRAMTNRELSLEEVTDRAMAGARQAVLRVDPST